MFGSRRLIALGLGFGAMVACAGTLLGMSAEATSAEPARQLDAAVAEGDLDRGAELAEEIAFAKLVEYLDASYELLRIHCQRGDEDEAFATVEAMLDAGYWDYRKLLTDEDLRLISSTDRLKALVRATWSKRYLSMLERSSRDEMQMPDRVMEVLSLRPGDVVADIGAGSGYFTVRIARDVGPYGAVIATDTRQEMLDYISDRVKGEGLENVHLVKVQSDETGLPAGTVDTVLMVDVMHYVKDRTAYARTLREALAPGGRLAIIDFRYDPEAVREFAPPPQQQVPRDVLDREMADAGLEVEASYDFLPEQYFVIYRAAE